MNKTNNTEASPYYCHRCGRRGLQSEYWSHPCSLTDERLDTLAAAMTGEWDPGDIFGILTARDVNLLVDEVRARRTAEKREPTS